MLINVAIAVLLEKMVDDEEKGGRSRLPFYAFWFPNTHQHLCGKPFLMADDTLGAVEQQKKEEVHYDAVEEFQPGSADVPRLGQGLGKSSNILVAHRNIS